MNRTVCTAILIITATLVPLGREIVTAQTPPPESLEIQQVALFKNGLGFFAGRVVCPEGKTSFEVALPVAPSHGTFWISYPAEFPLAAVTARHTDSTQMEEAVTIPEMLKANPGRRVRLLIGDREVTGIIRHVARDRDAPVQNPYASLPNPYYYHPPEQPQQASLLIVETEVGELSVDPRGITQVTFLDGKAERRFAGGGRSAVLHVQLKTPASGRELTVSFLAKGIAWAPSYRVDITDDGKARLSAKALVVNDACELKGVDARLVTGFPHLQFADIASPLSLQQDLAQFLQALSTGQADRGMIPPPIASNMMTQTVAYSDAGPTPADGAAQIGDVAEDLFLYPAGRLDIGRREVAYVPLFTDTVPCKHIYQWDIPDYVNEESVYQYSRKQPGREEEVWHGIRLTNTTKVPWTTAPGETVKDDVLLGQDTLRYTPPSAESTLRITRAIGVKAEQNEFETSRKREAGHFYGYAYDLITVQGRLSVVNFQDKAIDMEITKTVSGELKSSDPQAKVEKLAAGLQSVNGLIRLTWHLRLGPGERKEMGYVYDVYVRR